MGHVSGGLLGQRTNLGADFRRGHYFRAGGSSDDVDAEMQPRRRLSMLMAIAEESADEGLES